MKKIIIITLATTMLLSNVAFASTKKIDSNNTKNYNVSTIKEDAVYHVCTEDPFP